MSYLRNLCLFVYSGVQHILCYNGHRTNKRWRIQKGQSKKDNPEELTTMVTGQINVREYRRPKGINFGIL
jgi:hypothetical protein